MRTYQLLVSPSVVSYLIREQFYNYVPRQHTFEDSLPKKLEYTVYLLSLKEWNLDSFMNHIVWKPLRRVGRKLDFLTHNRLLMLFVPTFLLALIAYNFQDKLSAQSHLYLPILFAAIGLLMVLKSYSERKSPQMSWLLLIMNHFWVALAISFNEHFILEEVLFYLSGVVIAGGVGYACLRRLKLLEPKVDLNQFAGHVYEHPKLTLVFLLAAMGLMGFPITPTFIGEDLVFSHIHEDQIVLAFLCSIGFVFEGIAIVRIYGRVFLGPHTKHYHETAYRSS